MENKKMAERILEALKEDKKENINCVYGLRKCDHKYAVDEDCRESLQWDEENDCESEELMDGTCAVGFGDLWFNDDELDLETIDKALKVTQKYSGKYTYLIGRTSSYCGNDEEEEVIQSASVISIL